tara:strand:- start:90 stop:572 length:483 start_codon:yes stop_codon:yes gene_type:complete
MKKEFQKKSFNDLNQNKSTHKMGRKYLKIEERDKQNWLSELREEIKQDNLESGYSFNSNNYESDYASNESIDFSEEGVYEMALEFTENIAEYQYEQSLLKSEEVQDKWTLSNEEWKEYLLESEYESIYEKYDLLGNDKEFLKEVRRNDEFNDRNTPFLIY